MIGTDTQLAAYVTDINQWRQMMDDRLRASDGWLTFIGLHWLHDGINTIGTNPNNDVPLASDNLPAQLGALELNNGQVTIRVAAGVSLTVDDVPTSEALLHDDTHDKGPSLVTIGSVTFFIIKRDDLYGVRVRDSNNPARTAFTGRKWFPIDQRYRLVGKFVPHATPRILNIVTSTGHFNLMTNPGRVEFTLDGESLFLEAFSSNENEVWFVFRDKTSGSSTYKAGRFLYAPLNADGSVILDFNKAYHPPCAYTPYATCPLPPKENVLPIEIAVGEHV
jgi:uncharacterized protein (DUF1684 family)